ncbi:MAG: glycosyltransferase, partial [Burkholderiaceae bacterium]
SPERRLRVGFVSGDLRSHAVARFIEPVWRELSPQQVELFAYMNFPGEDAVSERLRGLVSTWRNVAGVNDDALFKQIRDDGIDILFDLSGHTGYNRLPLFARKPAPVQVSWIGYPGSTGLTAIDYRLVDEVVAPPGRFDRAYSERLAYLPAASVFGRPEALPEPTPLPALARGRFTFGSFNRANKIGDQVIELWSRVLGSVPGSQLLIGGLAGEPACAAMRERFARHGIGAERLLLRQRMDIDAYLRLHADVDLLLDTFPFAGGTTVNFALWMGVPIVTLLGAAPPQRIGATRMAAAGLNEFIAETPQAYHDIAVDWSRRLDELAALRAELRPRVEAASRTMPEQMARALETRMRQMWRRWCAGQPVETLH